MAKSETEKPKAAKIEALKLTDLEQWEEMRRQVIIDRNVLACMNPRVGQLQQRIIMEKANEAAMRLTVFSHVGLMEMQTIGGALTVLWLSLRKQFPDIEMDEVEDYIEDLDKAAKGLLDKSGVLMAKTDVKAPNKPAAIMQLQLITGNMDMQPKTVGKCCQVWYDLLEDVEKKTS